MVSVLILERFCRQRADGTATTSQAVSCASVSSCTAVGPLTDLTSGLLRTFAERWSGMRWAIEHPPNPAGPPDDQGGSLSGVWCAKAGGCIAVGSYTNDGLGSPGGVQTTLVEELDRGMD